MAERGQLDRKQLFFLNIVISFFYLLYYITY